MKNIKLRQLGLPFVASAISLSLGASPSVNLAPVADVPPTGITNTEIDYETAAERAADAAETVRLSRSEVVKLQRKLATRGYYMGRPTGHMNLRTRSALSTYQERNGLEAVGRPTEESMEALGIDTTDPVYKGSIDGRM